MEEEIKNYLKNSILSLIPRGHRRERATRSHQATSSGMSITRLRSGLPQSQPEPHVRTKSHARTQVQLRDRPVGEGQPGTQARTTPLESPSRAHAQPRPAAAQSTGMRRTHAHRGYARPRYLAPSFQGAGISPPMFRIG